MGGYSSTLFHLLYRFSPELRTDFERSDEHRWIQRYGFEEVTVGKDDDDAVEDGRNSRRRKFRKVVRERPGLVPSALFHIIGNTVFLRLSDVASGLPSYDEQILLSSMDSEQDATGYSQRSAYTTVYEELRLKLAEALKAGSKRLLATYLQTLLAYPEGCTKGETVFDPRSGDVIVQVPPLSAKSKLYPKEKALVDLVAAERMEGRRVLVYATHTGTRDITERMERHPHPARVPGGGDEGRRGGAGQEGGVGGGQGQAGHRRDDLPSQAGADRPRPHRLPDLGLVRDGLQRLRDAAGVAAVVAHRADPPGEGGVHGLPEHPPGRRAEAGGEEAAKLPRRRGRAAGGRAGRLRRRRGRPDDGVGPQDRQRRPGGGRGGDGGVRSSPRPGTPRPPPRSTWWTTTGRSGGGRTGGRQWQRGQRATATTTTASGRRRAIGRPNGNGHAPCPVNGNGTNGHHDEAPEPQQSLVSWAEFMAEEPVKPRGRGGKTQTPSLSLFEWAVETGAGGGAGRRGTLDRQGTGRSSHMERRPPRRWQRSEDRAITKEMNRWHACLFTTTESSPTRTPR